MAADTGNELPNKVKDKAEDIINFFITHLLFIYDEFSPSYENVSIFQGKIKKEFIESLRSGVLLGLKHCFRINGELWI
ncbi:hypothetical protein bcgnr5390_13400 [Bacillus luti]|nr:hypothetical protein BC2903_55180 [Bacillus cereus]